VDRISPEAPVPVFVPIKKEIKQGMALNVANNLENLGATVVKYVGEPSTKIRLIDQRTKQHVLRLDQDRISDKLSTDTEFDKSADAFVISDYNKGFVSYELVEKLIQTGQPVFVDTKKTDLKRFQGAFVKINHSEFQKAKTLCDNLIVTMGDRGVRYLEKTFSVPRVEITDVCGAGDTFLASLCYFYLTTKNIDRAIEYAILASTITIKHVGVYAPTMKEILCQG